MAETSKTALFAFWLSVRLCGFMAVSLRSPRIWLPLVLWTILILGLCCRFYGLNWDNGAGLHPDERFMTGLVPRISWPSSFSQWFDSSKSPLNPKNLKDVAYVYGQLPLMIAKVVIGDKDDIAKLLPLMRGLSAFFDSLTVLFSLLIGRRILGKNWGLFAATLVSLAALNIQQSHYFTTDSFAATFLTMAFWSGTRWLDTKKWYDALGLGIWFGCSLACKLSGAFFAVACLGFVIVAWRRYGTGYTFPLALCSVLLAFWTFRTFHPMMFMGQNRTFAKPFLFVLKGVPGPFDLRLDPRFLELATVNATDDDGKPITKREWVGDFGQQLGITSGAVDVPFNVQWVGRPKWLFSLANLGWWGFGWPLLIAGLAGGALALRRPRKAPALVIAALFVLISIGIQGAQFSKFTRYYIPLTPMFALLAAYCWRELLLFRPKLRPIVGVAFAYSLLWCLAITGIYGRTNTRLAASKWIADNLLPDTLITNETSWDEGLPISWVPPGSDIQLREQKLESYDLETPAKRLKIKEALDKSEWIFISSGRSWQNIPRWPQKWPMMTEFYRTLFSGELGFDKVQEFTNYPGIGPLRFPDYGLEEALSVYDHPRVMLFHKRSDFSMTNVDRILDNVSLPTTDQFTPNKAPAKWDSLPQPRE